MGVGFETKMIYRATVRRDSESGTDGYGNPVAESLETVETDVPCYVWHRSTDVYDTQREMVVNEYVTLAAFQIGADIRDNDVIEIFERDGTRHMERHRVEGKPANVKRYIRARLARFYGG